MKAKIKRSKRRLSDIVDDTVKEFKSDYVVNAYKEAILSEISRGVSPVKGEGGYEKYSDSYKKAIKSGYIKGKSSVSPVNLKASEKMLKSIKGRKTKKGFSIWFTSPIAKYHDKEEYARILRKMLPNRDGDDWSIPVKKKIIDLLRKVKENTIKKFKKKK